MEIKTIIIFCAIALVTQISLVSGQADPRLQSCVKKFIDQFDKIKIDKVPNCYDTEKLKQGNHDVAVFGKFYDTIPPQCKKPTKSNISECLKLISQKLDEHSDEMKAGLINSIHSYFSAGKLCYENAKSVFSNLDKYVLNGCKDL